MSSLAPLVSVIIPSYNHGRFVCEAVESVLAQTVRQVECIVIDDGSKDDSVQLLQRRFGSEKRVKLSSRENRGAHATLNEGLASAAGAYLAILNSDDAFESTRLERLVRLAQANPKGFFGITAVSVIDERGEPFNAGPAEYYQRVCQLAAKLPDVAGLWVGNIAMTTSNFFFSREVFRSVGQFRGLRYTHDWDFALRAAERYGLVRLPEPLVRYRVHGKNTIHESDLWKHIAENAWVFSMALRRLGLEGRGEACGMPPEKVMGLFLQNESFLPVPTLALMALDWSSERLEKGLSSGEIEKFIRESVDRSGFPKSVLFSTGHLVSRSSESTAPSAAASGRRARVRDLWRELRASNHWRPLEDALALLRDRIGRHKDEGGRQ